MECGEKGMSTVSGPTVGGVPTGAASVSSKPGGTEVSTVDSRRVNLSLEARLSTVHTRSTGPPTRVMKKQLDLKKNNSTKKNKNKKRAR